MPDLCQQVEFEEQPTTKESQFAKPTTRLAAALQSHRSIWFFPVKKKGEEKVALLLSKIFKRSKSQRFSSKLVIGTDEPHRSFNKSTKNQEKLVATFYQILAG